MPYCLSLRHPNPDLHKRHCPRTRAARQAHLLPSCGPSVSATEPHHRYQPTLRPRITLPTPQIPTSPTDQVYPSPSNRQVQPTTHHLGNAIPPVQDTNRCSPFLRHACPFALVLRSTRLGHRHCTRSFCALEASDRWVARADVVGSGGTCFDLILGCGCGCRKIY
jgi:hypothetical protein